MSSVPGGHVKHSSLCWSRKCIKTYQRTNRQMLSCWISAKHLTRCHEKLIHKLHGYGIRGETLSWTKTFLIGRSQTVFFERDCSEEVPVTSGVPQGSVPGPILFLVYMIGLPEKVKYQVRLFADDTAAYMAITKPSVSKQLQDDLDTSMNGN